MRNLVRNSMTLSIAAASALVSAQTFTVGETRHSIQNANVGISSGVDVRMDSDVDFYINGFNVVGGAGWDSNIDVQFNGSYFDFNTFSNDTYLLGTPITGSQSWFFGGFFGGMFGLDLLDPVGLGSYTTTIELLGGETADSTDVLLSFEETVDIVDFGLSLSSPDTFVYLPPLGSTNIRHQLGNGGANDFLIGSRYYGWSMAGRDQFDIEFSAGYPDRVAVGENVLVNHLDVTAHADFTNPFTFQSGIIGGLYSDDAVWVQVSEHTLTPVPEPSAMVGLGAAFLASAVRRRRRK